jgi:hypothetical protein
MLIGFAMEEIFNPKMKQSSSAYKIFRSLNNTYIQEVFNSMDEAGTAKRSEVDLNAQ